MKARPDFLSKACEVMRKNLQISSFASCGSQNFHRDITERRPFPTSRGDGNLLKMPKVRALLRTQRSASGFCDGRHDLLRDGFNLGVRQRFILRPVSYTHLTLPTIYSV